MFYLLLLFYLPQDFYYLDGVEIRMDNGTIIKTTANVIEDRLFYSWNEDGYNVTLAKERIVSLRYFSVRVKGRQPYAKSKTVSQRRLSGRPIAYEAGGKVFLKCRHVNGKGRSVEGTPLALNIVTNMTELQNNVDGKVMEVNFQKTTPGSRASFRFYDLKGKRLSTSYLNIPAGKGKKKGKKRKKGKKSEPQKMTLTVPGEFDLFKVGLVEVVSEKGGE